MNIEPSEGQLVARLMLHYGLFGVATALTQTVAFALFVARYGPQGLPYAYVGIAVLAPLAAFAYLKLAERLPLARALLINLGVLAVVSLLLWLGLVTGGPDWLIFLLPVWFQTMINQGTLGVWTLAGRVYDMRQGKRLFGLIGAGNWLSVVLAGLVVPPLVGLVGVNHLLLLAAVAVAASLAVQRGILRDHPAPFVAAPAPAAPTATATPVRRAQPLFRQPYVLLLFVLTLLWWASFFFVDNIFYSRAAQQYPQADELAAFLGVRVAIEGLLALFVSTFLVGRVVQRYGLQAGLLTLPLLLTLSVGALAISGGLATGLVVLFGLATLAKILSVGLGFSLDNTARVLLFQPLPTTLRVRALTLSDAIVQPLAVGLAGLILLVLTALIGPGGLPVVYIVIGIAWIMVVLGLLRRYPAVLARALDRRYLGVTTLNMADRSSLEALQKGLNSPHPEAVLYCLNVLETVQVEAFIDALPRLVHHPSPEVRKHAWARMEAQNLKGGLAPFRPLVEQETDPATRAVAIRAMAALAEPTPEIERALNDPVLAQGAIIGLLKNGRPDATLVASERLSELVESPEAADRATGANILGEVGIRSYFQPVARLLEDADVEVRRAALAAAGSIRNPKLWPSVLSALSHPKLGGDAAAALGAGGDGALEAIAQAIDSQPRDIQIRMLRACSRIKGEKTVPFLLSRIEGADPDIRHEAVIALSRLNYRGQDRQTGFTQVRQEAARAAQTLAGLTEVAALPESELLQAALREELQRCRERVLYWLSFSFGVRSILSARDALLGGRSHQRAYALELVDSALEPAMKGYLLPFLDDDPTQAARLGSAFDMPSLPAPERLNQLIQADDEAPWVRACALYTAGRGRHAGCRSAIRRVQDSSIPLIREMADWALARLEGGAPAAGREIMLSIVEKVIILKTIGMFANTPDHVLADVAAVLEEVWLEAGEALFQKGDEGDSLYIVVSGSVAVTDDDRLLNRHGPRGVVGELALLDREPRIATITADEETHLLGLAQEPFYELIADRPEVVRGIMRAITATLRDRLRDISEMQTRLAALEGRAR